MVDEVATWPPKKSGEGFLTLKKKLIIVVVIAVSFVVFLVSYMSGSFLSTGRVTTFYVCPDGETTVENLDLCPTTTTTTTTTQPTTTTSTTTTTATTTTTLPPCAGSYCVYMSSLTCSNKVITMELINSGPKVISGTEFAHFKMFVNGEETYIFLCSPLVTSPGESMTCTYPAASGTYDVEVRGLSVGNIETGSVSCD